MESMTLAANRVKTNCSFLEKINFTGSFSTRVFRRLPWPVRAEEMGGIHYVVSISEMGGIS